jgi:hypothetical protein
MNILKGQAKLTQKPTFPILFILLKKPPRAQPIVFCAGTVPALLTNSDAISAANYQPITPHIPKSAAHHLQSKFRIPKSELHLPHAAHQRMEQ